MEVIDAIAPLRRPLVALEGGFHSAGVAGSENSAVEQDGQTVVVRHPTVLRKLEDFDVAVFGEGVNLTNTLVMKYAYYQNQFLYAEDSGRRFKIGVRARF